MLTLEQLQHAFYQALFRKSGALESMLASDDVDARIQIYRNTISNALCHALSVIYPGIWKLLGKECADKAALIFCDTITNLPISGCLDKWGKKFPKFLGSVPAFSALPYLADYAWFEYIHHQAYCGYGKAVYYFESIFPIDEIQALLENPNIKTLELQRKSSYAIITRPAQQVLTLWVSQEKWHSLLLQDAEYA